MLSYRAKIERPSVNSRSAHFSIKLYKALINNSFYFRVDLKSSKKISQSRMAHEPQDFFATLHADSCSSCYPLNI